MRVKDSLAILRKDSEEDKAKEINKLKRKSNLI